MKLSRENIPFTMVANEVLVRDSISLKAKGMFAYLFSKPDDWDFSAERIASEMKEERKAIQSVLRELEESGLLKRERKQSGRVEYTITHSVETMPKDAPQLFGGTLTARAVRKVLRVAKKHTPKDAPVGVLVPVDVVYGKEVNEIIELFAPVNPSWRMLFRNKAQRAALERMVVTHGVEKVRQTVDFVCMVSGRKYAPTITTPVALEHKLGDLVAYAKKEMGGAPSMVHI